ncbi:MAG: hypothetical protein E7590_07450 [Ruminococcaceae bacterium]|nr:hypothetical protein [Oscillospiraceae bacterium]MBE6701908.1 hypothetical protein [Oscillospiraceae bacterium]
MEANEKKNGKKQLRRRYITLCICSYLVLVGPLLAVLCANRARYFTTVADTVKIGVGGLICLVMVALLIGGKLRVPSALIVLSFVFVMSWLLGNLLEDLMLLSGCALAGKAADWIFFVPHIRRLRERIHIERQATATADAVTAALERTGRV